MMKKLIVSLMALVAASCVYGADSLYNANELSLNFSSSIEAGHNYDANAAGGISYYITRNLGLEGSVPFYQSQGVSVSRVQFGGLFRVPVGIFAPYAGLGAEYNWYNASTAQWKEDWCGYAKGGLEIRIHKNWGVFTEARYFFPNVDSTFKSGTWLLGGGVRLVIW